MSQQEEKDVVNSNRNSHTASMSMAYHKQTADDFLTLQKIYHYLILFCIPFCIAVIVFSTFWADILAKKDKYTNLDNQWQACLTSADYQYIGLQQQLASATGKLQECIKGLYDAGTCDLLCAASIKFQCGVTPPNDIPLPTGHFLGGLSYIGVQCVIFAAIAHASMRRALYHPSWLMSTIALVFWFCFAIFTYYTVSPILPVPAQTNATLLSFMYYGSSYDKFNNLSSGSDNNCHKAYLYVWIYLAFILVIATTVFIGGFIGIYAERIRYKSKNRKEYEPLKHTEIPLIIGFLAIVCYVILVVCKLTASVTSMDAIYDFDNGVGKGKPLYFLQNYFPFAQPNLDISTILGVTSFMSVLRGYTIQSISAYRMACATALVFTFSTYPSIIGGFEFYYHNNFDNFNTCQNFFTAPGKYHLLLCVFYCNLTCAVLQVKHPLLVIQVIIKLKYTASASVLHLPHPLDYLHCCTF